MKASSLSLLALVCLFPIYIGVGFTLQSHPEYAGHPMAERAGLVQLLSLVAIMATYRCFSRSVETEEKERYRRYRKALRNDDSAALAKMNAAHWSY